MAQLEQLDSEIGISLMADATNNDSHIQVVTAPLSIQELPTSSGLSYEDIIYWKMGRVIQQRIPLRAVNNIIRRFPGWQSEGEPYPSKNRILRRQIMDSSVILDLSNLETDRRQVKESEDSVTIKLKEDIIGADIQCLLDIERQIPKIQDDEWQYVSMSNKKEELRQRFKTADNEYIPKGSIFTEKQALVAGLVPNFSDYTEIGDYLGTTDRTIYRLLAPVRERIMPGNKTRKHYIELTIAIAAIDRTALEHIPKGTTEVFSAKEKNLLAKYYSPNKEERSEILSWRSGSVISKLFKDMREAVEVKTQQQLVVRGIRDNIIELPNID